ncbi:MAG: tripartite tricarboxylate transporter substrate binding protein [Variovorax sp.]
MQAISHGTASPVAARAAACPRMACALAVGALMLPALAGAQTPSPSLSAYPTKPVHIVVPFLPGTASDTLARLVGARLATRLGQPFVIENKPGAAGNIGADAAVKAAPDGYTLMMATSSHVVNPSLYKKVNYDPVRDFAPVAMLVKIPSVLVVAPDSPAKTVAELVALARAAPGKLNYGSGGSGSLAHLSGATFARAAGLDLVHIPYKGAPEILVSVMSGQVQLGFPTLGTAVPQVRGGKLRALAVTSAKRNPQLPDVPTMIEALPPGFELVAWFGIWAPAGTPAVIIDRLNDEVNTMLKAPELVAKLTGDGSEVVPMEPAAFSAFVRTEAVKWAKIVKDSGASID